MTAKAARTGKRLKSFVVTVEIPEGVTDAQMQGYIEVAISTHRGQYIPDDAIWHIDTRKLKVRQLLSKGNR